MVCAAALRAPAALPERDAEEPVSYKFDRRRGHRRPAPGWLPATFTDGQGRFGVAGVDVIDAGPGGLGLRANRPIDAGMTISLHHPSAGFAAITATVTRCTPGEGQTYLIGLSTIPGRAA